MPNLYGMNELYPYTDRIIQDKLAQKRGSPSVEYLPFDFANHPARYIVLNLGTTTPVRFISDRTKNRRK